jgi:hypothetical protein
MKPSTYPFITILGMLCLCLFLAVTVSAQTKKETDEEKNKQQKSKEDGTIHLRIEKFENGEKKVYERTYKENETDGHSFPDGFMFQNGDSINSFNFFGNGLFDSIRVMNPTGKMFFDSLQNDMSDKPFFFNFDMDSLMNHSGNMFYQFDHSLMPTIDSILRKSLDANSFMFKNLGENFQFNMDTLFNKGFDFNWDDKSFPFGGGDMDLLLDKDQYEIEEIEKDGKTMLRIVPKKSSTTPDKKSENFSGDMQPSSNSLNLITKGNKGAVSLYYYVPADGLTTITVTNSKGKRVYREKIKNKAGKIVMDINLSKEVPGDYTVQVLHNGKSVSKTVTIR